MSLLKTLKERGILQDASHEKDLEKALASEKLSFYCGFDPTADSLHIGSMLPLVTMRRLQKAGHRPIVLLGSATGMIGDPSGKSEERNLLDEKAVAKNLAGIEKQISLFLEPGSFKLVKNDSWIKKLNIIEFLRDVGKHFSVNSMLAKDSVKTRIESKEQGISYTEFSYMILQAYDFYHLNKENNCRLQIGGSDQWGNITAGLELIRRRNEETHPQCFGMTFPLITTSSGAKLGKTEKGAVWLDAERTSPYEFYQYWINTSDADVIRYIKLFTEIEGEELSALEKQITSAPEKREAQKALAEELTSLIHGKAGLASAVAASRILFGEKIENIDSKTLKSIFKDVPSVNLASARLEQGVGILDLLVESSLAKSKGEARRLLEGGGIYVNNEKASNAQEQIDKARFIGGEVLVLRSGKKNYALVCSS